MITPLSGTSHPSHSVASASGGITLTVHASCHAPGSKSPPQPFMQLEILGWGTAKASAIPCTGSTTQLVLLGQNLELTELIGSLLCSYGLNLPLQSKTLSKSPPLGVFLYGSLHSHSILLLLLCLKFLFQLQWANFHLGLSIVTAGGFTPISYQTRAELK